MRSQHIKVQPIVKYAEIINGMYAVAEYLSEAQLGEQMFASYSPEGIILECVDIIPKYWNCVVYAECKRLAHKHDLQVAGDWVNARLVVRINIPKHNRRKYPENIGQWVIPKLSELDVRWELAGVSALF